MAYVCLSFSHRTAPLELRERLILNPDTLRSKFSDFVLLSTCNRVEIYATTHSVSSLHQNGDAAFELLKVISHCCRINIHQLNRHADLCFDSEAAQHLFRVAAGLESQIIGEPEILGQVSRAVKIAEQERHLDPSLRRLFQHAIKVGRRARSETQIARHSCSFASISMKLANEYFGDLADKNVLLVGAGAMAASFVKQLRRAEKVNIVSRSLERAQRLAKQVDGGAFELKHLQAKLAEADLVVTSTNSNKILLDVSHVEAALAKKAAKDLLIIDLSVPRNVETAVENLPGVRRFDIEDLNSIIQQSMQKQQLEVPHVERILFEELSQFVTRPEPVQREDSEWKLRLDDIRVGELRKIQSNDALEKRVCDLMDQFSKQLVQRIVKESSESSAPAKKGIGPPSGRKQDRTMRKWLGHEFDQPFSWGGFESDSNPAD